MTHTRRWFVVGLLSATLVPHLVQAKSNRGFEETTVMDDTPYVATRATAPAKPLATKTVAPVNPTAQTGIQRAPALDNADNTAAAYGKSSTRKSAGLSTATFADDDSVLSEQPRITTNLETVGKNRFQVESRFDYQRETNTAAGQSQYSFPTQFRYGFADPFEVHVKGNMFTLRDAGGGATRGFGDLALGTKWNIAEGAGLVPSIGVVADVGIPTGSDNVSDNAVVPAGAAVMQWKLPAEFLLDSNTGLDYPAGTATAARSARFTYGLAARRALPVLDNRLSAFVEMAGGVAFSKNYANTHQAGTGLSFRLNDHFDTSTFGRVGLSQAAPNFQTGVGLSWKP